MGEGISFKRNSKQSTTHSLLPPPQTRQTQNEGTNTFIGDKPKIDENKNPSLNLKPQYDFFFQAFVSSALFALLASPAAVLADKPAPAYAPAPAPYAPAPSYAPVEPAVYDFAWKVEDYESGNDFGQNEKRDGPTTNGQYSVALPDGRIQTVTYSVYGDGGYIADVAYSGEAKYEPAPAPSYKPAPKPAPAPAPKYEPKPAPAPEPKYKPVAAKPTAGPVYYKPYNA